MARLFAYAATLTVALGLIAWLSPLPDRVTDREIYERSAQMNRYASELLAQLLAPHLTWLAEAERPRAVDFAWRAVTAVMQQRLVFEGIEPGRYKFTERELASRLTTLFLGALEWTPQRVRR